MAGQNCTDFGVATAKDAGVEVPATQVNIKLTGKGTTPGQIGQDLRDDADKIKKGEPTKTKSAKAFTIVRAQGEDNKKNQKTATGTNMPN